MLTNRESEIVNLLADGAGNGLIAEALGISESTVQQHLDASRLKFGSASRAELVSRAIGLGAIRAKQSCDVLLLLEPLSTAEDEVVVARVTYASPAAVEARPSIGRLIGTFVTLGRGVTEAEATSSPNDASPQSGVEYSENGAIHLSGLLSDVVGPDAVAQETKWPEGRRFLLIQILERRAR